MSLYELLFSLLILGIITPFIPQLKNSRQQSLIVQELVLVRSLLRTTRSCALLNKQETPCIFYFKNQTATIMSTAVIHQHQFSELTIKKEKKITFYQSGVASPQSLEFSTKSKQRCAIIVSLRGRIRTEC